MQAGQPLSLDMAPRAAPRLARRIEGLAQRAPADLSFGNLWLFRRAHDYRLHDGEWPFITGRSYDGRPHALPLFDVAGAPPRVLQALVAQHGSLFPLTEREVAALDASVFAIGSNRDDSDYVCAGEQFREYPGRQLHNKRNLMAQFTGAHDIVALPYRPELAPQATQVLDGWLRDKRKLPGEADDLPCREALALAPQLRLEGFLYLADGEPVGFVLAEELQPAVWVVRFAKGLARCTGVAPFMFQHFARHAPRPAAWLNFEQDLGLPNFRRTKLSYQPALLLPKWRASQSAQDAAPPGG